MSAQAPAPVPALPSTPAPAASSAHMPQSTPAIAATPRQARTPSPVAPAAPSPRAAPPGRATRLSRRQKAAIVVRLLLRHGAKIPLARLPEPLQAELAQQMGNMAYVDRETLAEVMREFADELDAVGVTFPKGLADALASLDGQISPQTAARLRKEAGIRHHGDPWDQLRAADPAKLVELLAEESTEVSAVALSKLDAEKAAHLLGKLSRDQGKRIVYAMSMVKGITPSAVDRIGMALIARLGSGGERAFEEDPEDRIGAILNSAATATRDEMLTGLEAEDAAFATRVRKTIFTFAHLPQRVDARDIPKIARGVENDVLVTALAGAASAGEGEQAGSEFVLASLAKRMAEQLRESISERGKVKASEAEAAMSSIIAVVRELAQSGEILLTNSEEEEEEVI